MRDAAVLSGTWRNPAVLSMALYGAAAALSLGMFALLAQRLGPDGYGVLNYALGWCNLLAGLLTLGTPTMMVRFIAEYRANADHDLLHGLLRRVYQITLAMSVAGLLLIWSGTQRRWIALPSTASLLFAAAMLPVLVNVLWRTKALQSLGKIVASVAPDRILAPVLTILLIVACGAASLHQTLAIYALVSLACCLAGNFWLWRALPVDVRTSRPTFRTGQWARVALPVFAGGISQLVIYQADLLMLGTLGDMESTGRYAAACRLAAAHMVVLNAVNAAYARELGAAQAARSHTRLKTAILQSTAWAALCALPIVALCLVCPRQLLSLFGADFQTAAPLLRILSVGYFINAATSCVAPALIVAGRERLFAASVAAGAVAVVALHVALIPRFGAIGAAWGTVIALFSVNLGQWFALWKHLLQHDDLPPSPSSTPCR